MTSLALLEQEIDCTRIDITHLIQIAYAFKTVEIDFVRAKLLQLFLKNIRVPWIDELEKTGCNEAGIGRMSFMVIA